MKIRNTFTKEELEKYPELGKKNNLFALKYILNRITRGKNALILTYGVTGSGKSWLDIRIAELLCIVQGRKFDIANRIFFDFKGLLTYTNQKDLPPGDVSVSEELGVSMGARKWQRNISYSELLQTFRDLQTICLFNVPFRTMIDKHARLLSHFQIEMMSRKGNLNTIKLFLLQHNPSAKTDKKTTFEKYLRIERTNKWGSIIKKPIKVLRWKQPSKEVLDIYIPLQKEFKSNVRKRLAAKIKEGEVKEKKPVKQRKDEVYKTKQLLEQGVSLNDIAKILHKTSRCVWNYKKEIENERKMNENVT